MVIPANRLAHGEIVAFVDDDAMASPGWLANIVSAYTDETIGCVGAFADEGPATLGFLIRDTWVHLHAYSVRIVHPLALVAVGFPGKAVGAALTVRQLLSASRGLDEAPDQTSQ